MVFAVGRSTVSHSWLAFWLVLIQNMSTLVQVMAWHQAITWTNVSQVLCCHVASQGHHELYGKLPVHHIGTVRCRYNVDNILKNIHERHPIVRPLGRGMGCLLWIQHLVHITILNRVITALDCISHWSQEINFYLSILAVSMRYLLGSLLMSHGWLTLMAADN